MKISTPYLILILILLLISNQSILYAAPMSFKGSITSMATVRKDYISLESSFVITSKDAIGIRAYESKGNGYNLRAGGIFHLRKLMRINAINSQTNLWLFTGAGTINIEKNLGDKDYSYLSPTLQFDYETKRLFGLISHQFLRVGHENFDTTKIEGGFSFYETGYNETQPWFILKAKNTNSLDNQNEYTPTLRFINKSIYGEVGVTTDGDPSLHLMYTF
jgi:hypothetical protein